MPQAPQQSKSSSPLNGIMWITMVVFSIYLLFFIAKGIFSLLMYASPILIIASFFLDKSVIINFGKFLYNKVKTEPLIGIGAIALSFFAFPILSGYLFLKSLIKNKIGKKVKEFEEREKGEYADFEVVEDDFLQLPELEKPTNATKNKKTDSYDEYTELFD